MLATNVSKSISLPFSFLSMVAQVAASPTETVPIFEISDSQSGDYTGSWLVGCGAMYQRFGGIYFKLPC
jgi:hypothetical protein